MATIWHLPAEATSMRRLVYLVALAGAVVSLVGCGGSTNIPAGAEQVHVVATTSDVRLDPATVHAGAIYLVLDPTTEAIVLVQGERGAEGASAPLSDEALARLARGDSEGTSIEGFDVTGCDPARRSEDRGKVKVPGECGSAFMVTLDVGRYAILAGDPTTSSSGVVPAMAVLEVVP
jgi:hypothetical protein